MDRVICRVICRVIGRREDIVLDGVQYLINAYTSFVCFRENAFIGCKHLHVSYNIPEGRDRHRKIMEDYSTASTESAAVAGRDGIRVLCTPH
jgi:hypothetical protein